MITAGNVAAFWGLLLSLLAVCIGMQLGRKGFKFSCRSIAAYDSIKEAVGRATELGRPVMVVPGRGDLNDARAAQTLSALAILEYSARHCAQYDTTVLVPINKPNVFPLADEIVRTSYAAEGKPEKYQPGMVQFLSEEQFAFAGATVGMMQREKVASTILVGYFEAEAVVLAEAAGQVEAITIGGCGSVTQVPYFAAICDYCLIGEELMIADAYLNQKSESLGTVAGQDWIKIALMGLVLTGALLSSFGSNPLANLLSM